MRPRLGSCHIAAAALLLFLAAACRARDTSAAAEPTTTAAHQRRTITFAGTARDYLVHVPASARDNAPVVLVLHGGGGNAAVTVRMTGMSEAADRHGFIAVYPNGSGRLPRVLTWNAGRCCAFAAQRNVDDVGFLLAVIDDVVRRDRADAARVFATGISNGAMMSYRLAARAPERIRAIAPVAGGLEISPDSIRGPVPVLHVHGTADQNAPYDGGRGERSIAGVVFTSVAETIAAWARVNRADPRGRLERTVDTADDGMRVTFTRYAAPSTGADILLVTVMGGGHTWPGHPAAERLLGQTTRDIDVNEVMWQFFSSLPARRP